MPKAIVIRKQGGPEVLKIEEIPEPRRPGPGQVLIRHTAIGINYIDIYYRNGVYKAPKLPFVPGMEACGVVEAVGPDVDAVVGQRVAYATAQSGAYSEKRLISSKYLVGVPDGIPDKIVAAGLAKGLTAHYLLHRTFMVEPGQTILVHAAAGGTGQMICQWAKSLGANVIGTVGSPGKVAIAQKAGCTHVIVYTERDFVDEVLKVTRGRGVPVVYDSVGKDTFSKSLQCLSNMGLLVSFGQSSGNVAPFNILSLAAKGLYVTRPTLMVYKQQRRELVLSAVEVFNKILSREITVNIHKSYKLADIAQAHIDIASRNTVGSCVIEF